MKTGQSRLDDAIAYISTQVSQELANHVSMTVRAGNMTAIGKELSLGARTDGADDPAFGANTQQRQALRALLLCQRVYFSDLWWQDTYANGTTAPNNTLPVNWKAQSLHHWRNLPEFKIKDGIRVFATTNRSYATLAAAADGKPASPTLPSLSVTRLTQPFPGLISCYGAVMTWLVRSGIASVRWYGKWGGASTKATLTAAFGAGQPVIGPDQTFGPNDAFPAVPLGHIVHLFCDYGNRWNGHWLVSNGDGTASGCNNDVTDGTPNDYARACSLANQFRNGYRGALPDRPGNWRGQAVVIDPLAIPTLI